MSGKRKPVQRSPKDSSSSDDDTVCSRDKGHLPELDPGPLKTSSATGASVPDAYDSVASPSDGSTASGPIYVRPPGFEHHGQEITVKSSSSKGKKKKAVLTANTLELVPKSSALSFFKLVKSSAKCGPATSSSKTVSSTSTTETAASFPSTANPDLINSKGPLKPKVKKEPLPMKLRALPQSFWQQPNVACSVSPGTMYAKLPPLISKDTQDISEVRSESPQGDCQPIGLSPVDGTTKRIIRVANTDWLYKLFDGLDGSPRIPTIKRGRPKKVAPATYSRVLKNDDPCMGNAEVEALLPTLQQDRAQALPTLTMVSLRDRNKSVSLPALHIERLRLVSLHGLEALGMVVQTDEEIHENEMDFDWSLCMDWKHLEWWCKQMKKFMKMKW